MGCIGRPLPGCAAFRAARVLVLLAGLCAPLAACTAAGDKIPGQPFRRYATEDKFDRRIDFYLSEPAAGAAALPLIVFIQGAGCSSHFPIIGGKAGKGVADLLHDVVVRRARVLAVEKPGVVFLDEREGEPMRESCRPEFFREHTLERWTEAVAASIRAPARPRSAGNRLRLLGARPGKAP